MEGTPDPQTPEPAPALGTPQRSERFQVGDTVQIFQGTGPGVPGKKTLQFIGTVVGYNNDKGRDPNPYPYPNLNRNPNPN